MGCEKSNVKLSVSCFTSAKIARLEDEIEQLKELTELKKMRDKLKKKPMK